MRNSARIVAVVVLLLAFGLSGCTTSKWNRYELYMGQTYQDGKKQVSSERFQDFLSKQVTPKFSDGYTVLDAQGFWGGKGGFTYFERSKVIMIVSEDKDAEARVDEIAKAYKEEFDQESVLKIVSPVEVGFK
ncbi:DUF3574 domain-containing protein [Desulfovibrio sp. JC010]|uniref:DUF3574 domain-containing protein n=1 Tax=Desulfovibrio sp. JC010 TaxID=2593641 RepID=UPI0013D40BB3|nr:DUF3574 domain-containing protein [Desulfovibrio sp. JC010]NDV27804.1 DUF3574 domain-containing protein [Desulfovibrio sp. JC010]